MPQKKNQINGFWLFVMSNKGKWKAQGLEVGTSAQLMAMANPLWKSLTQEERKIWDARAKEERNLKRNERGTERLDNTGNVIGSRKDPLEEARKRREREIAETISNWHGKDLTQEKFYFINFQEMCETTVGEDENRTWLPREMAIAEYCLAKGITNLYHQFIWPTSIPLGFRLKAEQKSTEFHRIPVQEMEKDSHDYAYIFHKATELLKGGMTDEKYPPLYCLAQDYDKTKFLCDWLWINSASVSMIGRENPMGRVQSLEDLVCHLLTASGNPDTENIATFQIVKNLDGSQWDYISSTPCEFHKSMDVSRFCALGFVRKAAYTMSDMVAVHYGIELDEKHMPVREEQEIPSFRYVLPGKMSVKGNGRGRGIMKGQGGDTDKSYAKIARPSWKLLMESSSEEDGSASSSSKGSDWSQIPGSSAHAGGASVPVTFVPGQFADHRTGDGGIYDDSDESEDDVPAPTQQLAALTVTEKPPTARGGGRWARGAGAAPAVDNPTAVVGPPHGFRATNQNPVLTGGRGMASERDFLPTHMPDMPRPPIHHDNAWSNMANQRETVGRGRAPVGRGSMLGVSGGGGEQGQGQGFGRGRIGRGTRPGGDKSMQGFGRGVFLAGEPRFEVTPPLRSFVTAGASPAELRFGNEAAGPSNLEPRAGREAVMAEMVSADGSQVNPSTSVLGNKRLGTDSDNFELHIPDMQFIDAVIQHSGMAARGVGLGRGFIPPVRGRGSMPKQETGYM